jgi:hypothetical protein
LPGSGSERWGKTFIIALQSYDALFPILGLMGLVMASVALAASGKLEVAETQCHLLSLSHYVVVVVTVYPKDHSRWYVELVPPPPFNFPGLGPDLSPMFILMLTHLTSPLLLTPAPLSKLYNSRALPLPIPHDFEPINLPARHQLLSHRQQPQLHAQAQVLQSLPQVLRHHAYSSIMTEVAPSFDKGKCCALMPVFV